MKAIPFVCELELTKAVEEGGRWIVEGFAATSDFDLQEDVITPEAIEASSKDLLENSTVLLNHDSDQAIGKTLESEAREGGLFLRILVSKTVPEVWQRIKEGVLNKFSVRGRILEARKQWLPELQRFARMILKMHLLEVSLVSVPANPKAKAIGWHVEKALADYEAGGGAIEEMPPAGAGKGPRPQGGTAMQKNGPDVEVVLLEASGEPKGGGGAPDNGKGVTPAAVPVAPAGPAPELRKDAAGVLPLERLKGLLGELQALVKAAEAGKAPVPPEAPTPQAVPAELEKKLAGLEEGLKRLSGALGLAEGAAPPKGSSLPEVVAGLAKRLEALEKQPGQRSSLEGQESLPGEARKKGSLWKGVV